MNLTGKRLLGLGLRTGKRIPEGPKKKDGGVQLSESASALEVLCNTTNISVDVINASELILFNMRFVSGVPNILQTTRAGVLASVSVGEGGHQ